MSLPPRLAARYALVGLVAMAPARAQDFPDVQLLTNRALYAKQAEDQRRRDAERRRIEELGQRSEQQAALLQAQADAVRQLGGELTLVRDERQLLDIGQTFDAELARRHFALLRPLLAATVTVELSGSPESDGAPVSAEEFIASLPTLVAEGSVLPRSNQRARIEGTRATLTSDGYAWDRPGRIKTALDRYAGQFEYGFARAPDGWKLDRLTFRLSVP